MIFLIIGLLLMAALAYYDADFLSHWLWFVVALCYALTLNGCASINTDPDREIPFIYWEYLE